MNAVELLADLRARGVEIVADGDRLRFRPAETVTAGDRAALRTHKAELLPLLMSDAMPTIATTTSDPVSPAATSQARHSWSRITLIWPPTSTGPMVKGSWQRLADGRIEATDTRAGLYGALTAAGVDLQEWQP